MVRFDPRTISFSEAAVIQVGGLTALYFLRRAKISEGKKVLINGASGSVGTYTIQFAKLFGAEVTGVCSSRNLELVKSLDADYVIDYTTEDFTKNGKKYDMIFDTVDITSYFRCRESVLEYGFFLTIEWPFLLALWTSLFSKRKVIIGMAPDRTEDLIFIKDLVEKGKIKAVIDKTFPMDEAVEAYRYVDSGRKRGNVILTISRLVSSKDILQ